MPTVKEIKAELKRLKIKGVSGKTKAQLEAMLPKKGGSSQEEYDAYNKSLLRNDTLPKMRRKHEEYIKEHEEGPKKRNRERSEKKKAEKQAREAEEQRYIKEAKKEIEAEEQRKEKAIKHAIEGERKKYSKIKPKVVSHHLPPLDGNGKVSIKQIKAHLKELKVKGISGKNKEQLMAMLVKALNEKRGSGISDVAQKILGALIHSKLFHKVMEKFSGVGDSEQYHGSGIGSWAKNVVKVIKNPIASLKAEPKEVRNMLSKYGNHIVKTINVCRVPINSVVQVALNAITLGKFKKEMTNNNYDKMFHLYALLILDNGVVLLTERNQRVVLKPAPSSAKKAKDIMTVVANVSLNDLINRAVKKEGDAIWKYDPINNNCQRYVSSLLKSSNLFNSGMNDFINQKADKLLTGKSHSIATGITNIANIAENLARGGKVGSGNKSSGFIRAIMARNDDPKNAKMNKSKFRNLDKEGMKVDKMSKASKDVIKKKVKDEDYKEYLLSTAPPHQPLHKSRTNYKGTYNVKGSYVSYRKHKGIPITEARRGKKIDEPDFEDMFESKKMSNPIAIPTPRKRPQIAKKEPEPEPEPVKPIPTPRKKKQKEPEPEPEPEPVKPIPTPRKKKQKEPEPEPSKGEYDDEYKKFIDDRRERYESQYQAHKKMVDSIQMKAENNRKLGVAERNPYLSFMSAVNIVGPEEPYYPTLDEFIKMKEKEKYDKTPQAVIDVADRLRKSWDTKLDNYEKELLEPITNPQWIIPEQYYEDLNIKWLKDLIKNHTRKGEFKLTGAKRDDMMDFIEKQQKGEIERDIAHKKQNVKKIKEQFYNLDEFMKVIALPEKNIKESLDEVQELFREKRSKVSRSRNNDEIDTFNKWGEKEAQPVINFLQGALQPLRFLKEAFSIVHNIAFYYPINKPLNKYLKEMGLGPLSGSGLSKILMKE